MAQTTKDYQYDRNDNNTFGVRGKVDGGGTEVVANPEGTATADLEKLQVGETIYGIPEGINVVANPTLAGTESALTGLQVGDDKFAVPTDYPVNSYTADTTYTGDDLAQLIDDITHYRMIKIGSDVYHCIYAQANAIYWYVQLYNTSSAIYMNKVTIGYDTGHISSIVSSEATNGMTQADADARYLKLAGGTMTGAIVGANGDVLKDFNNTTIVYKGYGATQFGEHNSSTTIKSADVDLTHSRGGNAVNILDATNTSANPTLSGGEVTLSSLKLNGTNYAVGGGSLYEHNIKVNPGSRTMNVRLTYINNDATPITTTTLKNILSIERECSGISYDGPITNMYMVHSIYYSNNKYYVKVCAKLLPNVAEDTSTTLDFINVTEVVDNVRQIS